MVINNYSSSGALLHMLGAQFLFNFRMYSTDITVCYNYTCLIKSGCDVTGNHDNKGVTHSLTPSAQYSMWRNYTEN
jgi:hypothetical protein